MATTMMTSALSLALCILVLALSTASVLADRQATDGYCFRQRTPIGQRGKCTDEIHAPADAAVWDARECCRLGGEGWSLKANGKRCVNACMEVDESPLGTVDREALTESLVARQDETIQNDTATKWSEWSAWSNCSALCGVGFVTRRRTCFTEKGCDGPSVETNKCDANITCQVNGGWSDWSDWSECGEGSLCTTQTRTRTCTNPAPSAGGRDCRGLSSMTRNCACQAPVDGGWGPWSNWSACWGSCLETGLRYRTRGCNNPSPRNGGANCAGRFIDTNVCQSAC